MKISALEEIAYRHRWITRDQLLESAERYGKSTYGKHLMGIALNGLPR
jgi:glucose-1-phosphate thymidylyltransferase